MSTNYLIDCLEKLMAKLENFIDEQREFMQAISHKLDLHKPIIDEKEKGDT